MYSSVELFARLLQLSPDKLPRTEGMLSFRINSLQEGASANEGFRLDVATTATTPTRKNERKQLNTLHRRLAALSQLHQEAGFPAPARAGP
jgi:hypothetical protein